MSAIVAKTIILLNTVCYTPLMKLPHEQNETIPPNFYRVSTKALILDESRTKFLIVRESNGKWEFPGGGLDYGSDAQENVHHELMEEMGIKTTSVAELPSYVLTAQHDRTGSWIMQLFYETTVENLDFTKSRECTAIMFADKDSLPKTMYSNVPLFVEMFDPQKHKKL